MSSRVVCTVTSSSGTQDDGDEAVWFGAFEIKEASDKEAQDKISIVARVVCTTTSPSGTQDDGDEAVWFGAFEIKEALDKEAQNKISITAQNTKPKEAIPSTEKMKAKRQRCEFLETQAEVAGNDSSDESSCDGDGSLCDFVVEEATQSEVTAEEMQLIYATSLRSLSPGVYAPQLAVPQDPRDFFSQNPEEDDDFELDSFTVDSDEVEYNDEPDELEIAEQGAKEKRERSKKAKKRKRIIQPSQSSDDEIFGVTNL